MWLEIKNVSLFFIGLIILMVGIFIVIFDYPQIQYFGNFEIDSDLLLDEEKKNFYQRLKIEFSLGVIFLVIGIVICIFSLIKKIEKKN
jgi:flagellar biosynthesis protein FliQ